jgi:hypothetical protein
VETSSLTTVRCPHIPWRLARSRPSPDKGEVNGIALGRAAPCALAGSTAPSVERSGASSIGTVGAPREPTAPPLAPAQARLPLPTSAAEPGLGLVALRALVQREGPERAPEQAAADDAAHAVLRRAVRERSAEARAEIAGYVGALGAKVASGVPLTVHEHTAVSFLLRVGMFDEAAHAGASDEDRQLSREARETLERSLAASWVHLTGRDPGAEGRLERLPRAVLRKASRKDRVYHAASFQPLGKDRSVRLEAASLFRDYVPENQDVLLATGALLAAAFTDAGKWVVGGAILQYVVHTVTENVLHDHIAHPKGRAGEWFERGPGPDAGWVERAVHGVLGKVMKTQVERTSISHVNLHHGWTFRRSFTKMFDEQLTRAEVDKLIDKYFPADLRQKIRDEDYACSLGAAGMAKIFTTIAPQTALMIAAGALLGAPAWMLVPTILSAALYPVAMGKGHPIYHVGETEARESASEFMKLLRSTRYISYSARNHWMHHEYPNTNFNLSYPGADALFGQLLQPNLEDLFRMADDDVLHF